MIFFPSVVAISFGLLVSNSAIANTYANIGDVDSVYGDVYLTSPAKERKIAEGNNLFEGETIITQKDGIMKATLIDGGSLSVKSNSEVKLNKYLLNSDKPTGGLSLNKGAFRLVSGRINKVNDGKLNIETPLATLGIRGTDFYANYDDESLTVALFDNGMIEVATNAGGTLLLNEPMTFVKIGANEGMPKIQPLSASQLNKMRDQFNTNSSSWMIQALLFSILALYLGFMYLYNRREAEE